MIKKTYLQGSFVSSDIPPFPCPQCGASLMLRKESLSCRESQESRFFFNEVDPDPEQGFGTFVMELVCSARQCSEAVNCVGKYAMDRVEHPDGGIELTEALTPLFFYPTIPLFALPDEFPEKIKKPLVDAFSLFWSSPAAAGNALRICLEAMMDYHGIKKTGKNTKNGKIFQLSLHARILLFQKKKSDVAEKLLALKWLGNSGSHLSGLTKSDVVLGFRLIQYVIEELFEKRSETLAKAARRINKREGPA